MSDSVRPHRWQPTRLLCPWDSPGKNTGVGCHFLLQCMKVKSENEVAQLCPTLCNPMDCSLPGSFIHGIFQARVLEWGAIAFSVPSTALDLIFFLCLLYLYFYILCHYLIIILQILFTSLPRLNVKVYIFLLELFKLQIFVSYIGNFTSIEFKWSL